MRRPLITGRRDRREGGAEHHGMRDTTERCHEFELHGDLEAISAHGVVPFSIEAVMLQ